MISLSAYHCFHWVLNTAFVVCFPVMSLCDYHCFHWVLTTAFTVCLPLLSMSAHHCFSCVLTAVLIVCWPLFWLRAAVIFDWAWHTSYLFTSSCADHRFHRVLTTTFTDCSPLLLLCADQFSLYADTVLIGRERCALQLWQQSVQSEARQPRQLSVGPQVWQHFHVTHRPHCRPHQQRRWATSAF